ncbi:DNA repair protein complementing XP-C cells [Strongyloides ratti]|uniref:DNA repair protein complementing XP-C cells n=1 Tax=Strongyloides ratti TaxID=34506 RepID=A0A090LHM4_STRRB|nr:DNA repair protein complementing XP-C cells [Strongyloides ratti]CEF67015.1 DNA repair protein complementing XP-C cells [Strongyloides ratti]
MRTRRSTQQPLKIEDPISFSESSSSDNSSDEYEPDVEYKRRKNRVRKTDETENVKMLKENTNTKKRSSPIKNSSVPVKKTKNKVKDEEEELSSDGDDWEDVDLEDDVLVINLDGRTLDPAEERKKRLAAIKRRENLERKNKIKGEHVKEFVDVLENLCKGYIAFKNNSIDFEADIKKIVKFKDEKLLIEAPCPSEMKNELKRTFYSFIALNTININCRVCSPCNPPSLLLNVKKLKFEGEKRYFFIEIFNKPKEKWIPIDVMSNEFGNLTAEAFNDPNIMYILSIDFRGVIRDVVGKYTKSFIFHRFRQSRLPKEFMDETFRIYSEGKPIDNYFDDLENTLMLKSLEEQDKDVLKAEAVWPPDTKPIGKVGKYNVYPRSSIKQLYSSIKLLMEGLDVKEGEEPIKIVGRIPRASDRPDMVEPDKKPLYGVWQTVKYKTPKLVDGRIEPNKYGNLYIFKPWMIPEGCVHITEYTDYKKYADELEIQAIPAVVGFDTKKGKTYPVCSGFVVRKKDAKKLTDHLDKNREKIQKVKASRNANKAKRLIERQINQANILNPTKE